MPSFVVSDNVIVTSSLSNKLLSVSDAITIGESVSGVIAWCINVTDNVIVTGALQTKRVINVSDAVTIGEIFSAFQPLKEPVVTDALTIGEIATPNLRSYVSVSDAITVGETVPSNIAWLPRVTDTITVGEVFNTPIAGALLVNVTDTVSVLESLSFHRTAPTNFSFYKKLTIQTSEVPSAQTSFAVLLPFIAGDSRFKSIANGGTIYNNGLDIRPYSDTAFANPLTYEFVPGTYDPAQGSFQMWVNITAQDGAVIYLAYSNPICDFDGSSSATWENNYKGVFHLANAVGGTFIGVDTAGSTPISNVPTPEVGGTDINVADSTSAAVFTPVNHGVMEGVGITGASGVFSAVQSQYISLSSIDTHYSPITVKAWLLLNSTGTAMYIVSKGKVTGQTEWALYYDGTHVAFAANNGAPVGIIGGTTLAAHTWYHAVGVYDGSIWRLYLNGVADASPVTTTGPLITTGEHEIGALQTSGTPGQFWDGALGEVRISNNARLADWITTEYNNQSNLSAFWLTGPETNVGSIAVTDAVTVTDTPVLNLRSFQSVTDAVTVGEAATVTLQSPLNLTDAITVGETVSTVILNRFAINAFEPIHIGEASSLALIAPLAVTVSDGLTITDSPQIQERYFVSQADAVTIVETVSARVFRIDVNMIDVDEFISTLETLNMDEITVATICVPFRANAVPTVQARRTVAPTPAPSRTEVEPEDCNQIEELIHT